MNFTNCLFDWVEVTLAAIGGELHNNTFHGGDLVMDAVLGEFHLHNNLFDQDGPGPERQRGHEQP